MRITSVQVMSKQSGLFAFVLKQQNIHDTSHSLAWRHHRHMDVHLQFLFKMGWQEMMNGGTDEEKKNICKKKKKEKKENRKKIKQRILPPPPNIKSDVKYTKIENNYSSRHGAMEGGSLSEPAYLAEEQCSILGLFKASSTRWSSTPSTNTSFTQPTKPVL